MWSKPVTASLQSAVRRTFEKRVSMTDVLVIVASATLVGHPVLNGTYAEATHQLETSQDVALVADVDGEPVAGVVSDVHTRSLSEIVDARQAIDGSDDTPATATFSIANAAETESRGRLVNPPAVAALDVDPTGQRAVPDGDGVDLRPLVTAGLTYDARAVDATDATVFLEAFFEQLSEAPKRILESYRGRE
jgi:pyruvate dehydrogenase E2 component (dihydrolipoamide acetyltransferase)